MPRRLVASYGRNVGWYRKGCKATLGDRQTTAVWHAAGAGKPGQELKPSTASARNSGVKIIITWLGD